MPGMSLFSFSFSRRGTSIVTVLLLSLSVHVAATEEASTNLHVQETRLAILPLGVNHGSLITSSNLQHVAYVDWSGSGQCVVLDGNRGPVFQRIYEEVLAFSPDGQCLAYIVLTNGHKAAVLDHQALSLAGETLVDFSFSPSGHRLATVFVAFDNSFGRVCVDQQRGRRYDAILQGTLRFSPDGEHFCYMARKEGQVVVVVDGEEVGWLDGEADPATLNPDDESPEFKPPIGLFDSTALVSAPFSPDGQHTAFKVQQDGSHFVLRDGKPMKPYEDGLDGDPVFSPDSQRLLYAALRDGKWYLDVDDESLGPYEGLFNRSAIFSPDSRRLAFSARLGTECVLWLDGQVISNRYDIVGPLAFSPDSQQLVYGAKREGESFLVREGREAHYCDRVWGGTLRFSSDSKRLAAELQRGNKRFQLVDDSEFGPYDRIRGFRFSADGQAFAFMAQRDGCYWVILDGTEFGPYDRLPIRTVTFSTDGRSAAWVAMLDDQWHIVIDGVPSAPYDHTAWTTTLRPAALTAEFKLAALHHSAGPIAMLSRDDTAAFQTIMVRGDEVLRITASLP